MRMLISSRELLGCNVSQCSLFFSLAWDPTVAAFREETGLSGAVLRLTAVMKVVCLKSSMPTSEFMLSDTSILQGFEDGCFPALVLIISAHMIYKQL